MTVGVGVGVSAITAGVVASQDERISSVVSDQLEYLGEKLAANVPLVKHHSRLVGIATAALVGVAALYYVR